MVPDNRLETFTKIIFVVRLEFAVVFVLEQVVDVSVQHPSRMVGTIPRTARIVRTEDFLSVHVEQKLVIRSEEHGANFSDGGCCLRTGESPTAVPQIPERIVVVAPNQVDVFADDPLTVGPERIEEIVSGGKHEVAHVNQSIVFGDNCVCTVDNRIGHAPSSFRTDANVAGRDCAPVSHAHQFGFRLRSERTTTVFDDVRVAQMPIGREKPTHFTTSFFIVNGGILPPNIEVVKPF